MNWKTLLQSASESVNDGLRLRIEYLTAENRILRQQIAGFNSRIGIAKNWVRLVGNEVAKL